MKTKNRLGEKPMMFEVSKEEAIDIDEEIDFQIAEKFCTENNKYRRCKFNYL